MDLVSQLKRDEGVRLKPYRDTVGKLTIGVGRNLDDEGITDVEAEYLLVNDIDRVETLLHSLLPWTDGLETTRKAVLINMGFNMGVYELLHFKKTLSLVQAGDYAGAAREMLNSQWAKQVGDRAERLSQQMETGEWR